MVKQDFETEELKAELERALGFRLRSLERLDGARALNFKAVRDSDGFAFAVKCAPPNERQGLFRHLLEHLEVTEGTRAVRRVFEKECPATFHGCRLVCMSWCDGVRLLPDELTPEQLAVFLDDYRAFSAAMQKARLYLPHNPSVKWRREALAKCRGVGGRILRRILEEIPEEELAYRADLLRIVHGDFHHGNFLFVDGRVAGYLDLEEFCQGYPTDDMLRYFCCAAEHLRWYEWRRKRRVLRQFARAVALLPYSRHEWLVAVNVRFVNRVFMRTGSRDRVGLWPALHLAFRARFYRAMRGIVRLAFPPDA